jgi:hypothetical protein
MPKISLIFLGMVTCPFVVTRINYTPIKM